MKSMMIEAAKKALRMVLGMQKRDNVLVVCDEKNREIGNAFAEASVALGGRVEIYILPEKKRPLTEIPPDLHPIIKNKQIIVNALKGVAEETPFRIKLIKKEIAGDAKVAHAPGITKEMFIEGPLQVDYEEIARRATRLMQKLAGARAAYITTSAGTDLYLEIKDRGWDTDVEIKEGKFGNLPVGEIWCAPHEDKGKGIVVCDGSIGDLGAVAKPLRIAIRSGRIASLYSEDRELVKRVKELTSVDKEASVLGELGIGLNPKARITGNLLEDEKAGGTAHIAFGNNREMPGGKNNSKTHRDFLFHAPTIEIEYLNGEKLCLMKKGDLVV